MDSHPFNVGIGSQLSPFFFLLQDEQQLNKLILRNFDEQTLDKDEQQIHTQETACLFDNFDDVQKDAILLKLLFCKDSEYLSELGDVKSITNNGVLDQYYVDANYKKTNLYIKSLLLEIVDDDGIVSLQNEITSNEKILDHPLIQNKIDTFGHIFHQSVQRIISMRLENSRAKQFYNETVKLLMQYQQLFESPSEQCVNALLFQLDRKQHLSVMNHMIHYNVMSTSAFNKLLKQTLNKEKDHYTGKEFVNLFYSDTKFMRYEMQCAQTLKNPVFFDRAKAVFPKPKSIEEPIDEQIKKDVKESEYASIFFEAFEGQIKEIEDEKSTRQSFESKGSDSGQDPVSKSGDKKQRRRRSQRSLRFDVAVNDDMKALMNQVVLHTSVYRKGPELMNKLRKINQIEHDKLKKGVEDERNKKESSQQVLYYDTQSEQIFRSKVELECYRNQSGQIYDGQPIREFTYTQITIIFGKNRVDIVKMNETYFTENSFFSLIKSFFKPNVKWKVDIDMDMSDQKTQSLIISTVYDLFDQI